MPNTDGPQSSAKYQPTAAELSQLERVFSYHAPKSDQPERYTLIRATAKQFATVLLCSSPPSRERSLAMTALEEVVMWGNAAIARGE